MVGSIRSKYDVIIIGAGPAGLYTSLRLKEAGLRVLVIEEDKEIGKPRFCTGLIGKEAFDKFHIPHDSIENEFNSAWIFSPLGSKVNLKARGIQVCATNRTVFDQGIYSLAKKRGVDFLLNCCCVGLKLNDDYAQGRVKLEGRETTVKSKVFVLATGIKYNLHRQLGIETPANFLDCSQVQIPGHSDDGIKIFVGNSVAPRSFAWVVPIGEDMLRIGLSTYQNSSVFLRLFLKNLKIKGYINKELDTGVVRRPVPLGTIKTTYAGRLLIVGDAAGQVKPFTGGGIYFGLICAEIAAKTAIAAFKKEDFSANFFRCYEVEWKKKIEFDLKMGLYLRKLLANFNDTQMEKFVQFCAQEPIQRLIRKYADFNHHGKLIKELIKKPIFWSNLYQMLVVR